MPKVIERKKSKGGKAASYACRKCTKPIIPGETYYEWSFRYGPTQRQHTEHGRPKPSELTQSKYSTVLAAIETFQETTFDSVDDMGSSLREVAEAAREVAEEYRDAVQQMNMEGAGTQNEERADALDTFAEEVESTADDIESLDIDEYVETERANNSERFDAVEAYAEVVKVGEEDNPESPEDPGETAEDIEVEMQEDAEEEMLREAGEKADEALGNLEQL